MIFLERKFPIGRCIAVLRLRPIGSWGQRDYGVEGQLGSEKTVEEHIEKLVAGFAVLRQKLRDDGVLFLNYGDKYGGGNNKSSGNDAKMVQKFSARGSGTFLEGSNLRSGDLIGLAWRLALALQADGWILRSDTIWAKAVSFCSKYSGSTMPESVNGWRWERHKVEQCPQCESLESFKKKVCRKCGFKKNKKRTEAGELGGFRNHSGDNIEQEVEYIDCLGCAKCEKNDGLVLRRGSWRPTRAHEYLFILTKTGNYYCDMEAVREELVTDPAALKARVEAGKKVGKGRGDALSVEAWGPKTNSYEPSGRNLRDVWTINPQAYPDAHYATFPEKLVEPCIKVATSQKGVCPTCGSQWARVVDSNTVYRERPNAHVKYKSGGRQPDQRKLGVSSTTLGWRPTCGCSIKEPVPAIVYDPFMGSGTVAAVAARLGRNYIGSELNKSYITEQADYRVAEAETGISKAEQVAGQGSLFSE